MIWNTRKGPKIWVGIHIWLSFLTIIIYFHCLSLFLNLFYNNYHQVLDVIFHLSRYWGGLPFFKIVRSSPILQNIEAVFHFPKYWGCCWYFSGAGRVRLGWTVLTVIIELYLSSTSYELANWSWAWQKRKRKEQNEWKKVEY